MFAEWVSSALVANNVNLMTDLNATAFTEHDVGIRTAITDTAARGSLLVAATNSQDGGAITTLAIDGAAGALFETPDVPVVVALDEERLVWVTAGGNGTGFWHAPQIHWAPVNGTTVGAAVDGPVLDQGTVNVLAAIRFAGDLAATVACVPPPPQGAFPPPDCTLYIVRFSTKSVFKLHARPGGNFFLPVLGVSPAEILVGEADSANPSGVLERILRLDVASVESLGW